MVINGIMTYYENFISDGREGKRLMNIEQSTMNNIEYLRFFAGSE